MRIKQIKAQAKGNFKRDQSDLMLVGFAAVVFLSAISLITATLSYYLLIGALQVGIYYVFYRNSQGLDIAPQEALYGYKERFGPAFVAGFVVALISSLPKIMKVFTFIASLMEILTALGISGFGTTTFYAEIGSSITIVMLVLDVLCYIVTLSLSMTMYIMARNPEIDAFEALTLSREMMHHHLLKFFLLRLSFIGWMALALITIGLSKIYSDPYRYASEVVFFNERYEEYYLNLQEDEGRAE